MSDVRTYQILERLKDFVEQKQRYCHPDDNQSFDMLIQIGAQIESEMECLELPSGWVEARLQKQMEQHEYDPDQ